MIEAKPSGYGLAYSLSLIISISLSILYAIGQTDLKFMRIFSNIIFAPVAFAPVVVAFETSRRYGWEFESKLGFIWLTFLAGLFLWFLGEFAWAVYVLGFRIDVPYPSVADVFYLLGYPAFIYGLIMYFMEFRPALSLKTARLGLLIAAVVIVLTVGFLYAPIVTSSEDPSTVSLDLLYITLDSIILIFSAEAFILTLSYHSIVGGRFMEGLALLDSRRDPRRRCRSPLQLPKVARCLLRRASFRAVVPLGLRSLLFSFLYSWQGTIAKQTRQISSRI